MYSVVTTALSMVKCLLLKNNYQRPILVTGNRNLMLQSFKMNTELFTKHTGHRQKFAKDIFKAESGKLAIVMS